ncbi:7094_t:CDS:1, partial [Scutellospora calospora]
WYSKSAKNDDSPRQNSSEQCYDKGISTTKNKKVAFKQYLKNAEDGIGVEKDERIGVEKDERIGVEKDERVGIEKDK